MLGNASLHCGGGSKGRPAKGGSKEEGGGQLKEFSARKNNQKWSGVRDWLRKERERERALQGKMPNPKFFQIEELRLTKQDNMGIKRWLSYGSCGTIYNSCLIYIEEGLMQTVMNWRPESGLLVLGWLNPKKSVDHHIVWMEPEVMRKS